MTTPTHAEFLNTEDKTEIHNFFYYGDEFVKCNKAKRALNKTLETDYKAVYRKKSTIKNAGDWKVDDVDWDGEEFFVITAADRVLMFTNSEWGGVGISKASQ